MLIGLRRTTTMTVLTGVVRLVLVLLATRAMRMRICQQDLQLKGRQEGSREQKHSQKLKISDDIYQRIVEQPCASVESAMF